MNKPTLNLVILLFIFVYVAPASADTSFLVKFDSTLTNTGENGGFSTHVLASFLITTVEGEEGRYRGTGRLRYIALSGLPAVGADGILTIRDMLISTQDGTVDLTLFPGNPKPTEWLIFPPAPPQKSFQWFGSFGNFHINESGAGGFLIRDWEYPDGEIYARKSYNRSQVFETLQMVESTTIEIRQVEDPPRIDKINILSAGISVNDPEAGKDAILTADLYTPFPFDIRKCTWTGNNFTGPGVGDPDDSCRWKYKPKKGEGPKRDTYGDKNLKLTIVYDFGVNASALDLSLSKQYKVFFSKKGDDNSNSQPNWFDYWGDDGAVPGLDDSNVNYRASLNSIAAADGTNVIFGAIAADADGTINVPANPICQGGTFPGAKGIDLSAISLAHERKHNQVDSIGGTDTDGDGVPDSAEAGTSTTNRDSCNLAGVIHADYSSDGDHEFIARGAELGVTGVAANDWAVPGRQAIRKTPGSITRQSSRHQLKADLASQVQIISTSTLTGVYSAAGDDSDNDGLFNTMVLDVGVNNSTDDNYTVTAWLADNTGTDVIFANVDANLPAGDSTLQIVFDGLALYKLGVAQPFLVSRVELYARVGKHVVLRDAAEDVLITAFNSGDFDPPAATLSSVLSDSPQDTDEDSLYNKLDITIEVNVFEPGEYEIHGQMAGTTLSMSASQIINVTESNTAEQVVLSFDGSSIFFYRENGPWELTHLDLSKVAESGTLDKQVNTWTTAAYQYTDFQQSGIVIDETSYADSGGELDEKGKFITLDVILDIGSMVPGPYRLLASLENDMGNTIATSSQIIGLAGVESVSEVTMAIISFDGRDISASAIDGPYYLTGVSVISDDGIVMDQNPTPYITAFYTADQFTGEVVIPEEVIFDDGFE
jgi:hypothetical protein